MKQMGRRGLALLLAGALLAALLSGCGNDKKTEAPLPEEGSPTEIVTESGETVEVTEPIQADSYETLYQAFSGVQKTANEIYEISEQAKVPEEQLVNAEAELFGDPDYSLAEAPAEGVSEGAQIVADDNYIYMVCASELVIVSASGETTQEVGRVFVTNPPPEGYSGSETPQAVYLSGDNLYVITYEYLYSQHAETGAFQSSEKVHVKQYNVSDCSNPSIVADFAQSGRYLNSYLSNGVLYLIGAHSVWAPDEAAPETFVPTITQNGEDALLEASAIYICPGLDSTDYTVLSAIDAESGAHLATEALTGYHAWSAADGQNLYLARTSYSYSMSDPYKADQYSVTDFTYNAYTRLVKLTMDGSLRLTASGTVEGYLFGQGAMSLSGGNLYLGTACNGYAYKIFTDEKYGFVNYQVGDRTLTNAVYALDGDLNVLRSLQDAAGGQSVYSIRFTGSTAYAMGFDSLIPLYAVDMTAETLSPVQVSGLSGMEHNLYFFGEGQTAGVGVARSESGEAVGLQLAVYRTEGTDITLVDNSVVSEQWSQAMNNPAAVLVFPEQQMIAVPAETSYLLFTLQDGKLTEAGTVEMGYVSAGTRAFRLGDFWYFCNDATVVAVSAGDLTQVAKCDFAYG